MEACQTVAGSSPSAIRDKGWPELRVEIALLPQGLSNALGNPSVRLAVNDHRVNAPSDVVDGCIAGYLDHAGLWIDLAFAHSASIGEYGIVHLIVRRLRASPFFSSSLKVGSRQFLRQLEEIESPDWCCEP